MKPRRAATKPEPVISLINIVFLILIFFMVAGTLSQSRGTGIAFIQTTDLDCCVDPAALLITADGALQTVDGARTTVDSVIAAATELPSTIRLLPDRNLPAATLLETIAEFKAAGAGRIVIVTETTDG